MAPTVGEIIPKLVSSNYYFSNFTASLPMSFSKKLGCGGGKSCNGIYWSLVVVLVVLGGALCDCGCGGLQYW